MRVHFIFALSLFVTLASAQNIGIGTNRPDSTAALHISDSSRGILIPRMTMNRKLNIQHPAEGLMVYQTDSTKGFWYYSGAEWNLQGLRRGNAKGEILYWNGSAWISLSPGNNGQYLKWCNGVPTWGICTPTLYTTIDADTMNKESAGIYGLISLDGGDLVKKYGFVYGPQSNPTISNSFKTVDSSSCCYNYFGRIFYGFLDSSIDVNVPCYFRAYATNSAGTSYGNETSILLRDICAVKPSPTNRLYIVGSATPGGWSNPVPIPSQEFTRISSYVYEINIYLIANQKYLLLPENGSWERKYGMTTDCIQTGNCGVIGLFKFIEEGLDINGPIVSGNYKIRVDFLRGKIEVLKVN